MAEQDGRVLRDAAALLDPGERILWHGKPQIGGLLPPSTLALLLVVEAVPLGFIVFGAVMGEWPLAGVGLIVCLGMGLYILSQIRFAARTIYILTDRRALTLTNGRITRQDSAVSMPELELRPRGASHGDVVFRWIVTHNGKAAAKRTPEGFLALRDAARVVERLRAWRAERSAQSTEILAGFLAAAQAGDAAASEAAGHGRTLSSRELGIAITVPADWRVEVASVRTSGVVRPEPSWQPHGSAAPGWNAIAFRSPVAPAAIEVTVAEGPLPITFEAARDEPWARRLGLVPLLAEPEVAIGPWRGFSIAHSLRGAGLFGFALFDAPILQRQVWLDDGVRHILVRLVAEEQAVDLQHALDAMLRTLRPA
jgi:hypothetical protein